MILLLSGLEKTDMGLSVSESQRRSGRKKCQNKSLKARKAIVEQQEGEIGKRKERNMSTDVTTAL